MQEFTLAGQIRLCRPDRDWEVEGEITEDHERVKLSRLRPGEQFVYVFDLGDDWAHLCTVGAQRIDPVEGLGILPGTPRLDPAAVTTVIPVSKPYVAESLQGPPPAARWRRSATTSVTAVVATRRRPSRLSAGHVRLRSTYRSAIWDVSSPSELVAGLAPYVRP